MTLQSSKMPVARLRRIVEAAGATLQVQDTGRHLEYLATAKRGHHWESGLSQLVNSMVKGPASWSEGNRQELAVRVAQYGNTEKCTKERCGLCNAADPNCRHCQGSGVHYEDVVGDGGPRMPTTCECVEEEIP